MYWMGKGKLRVRNSKQEPEHNLANYTKVFEFDPRVNEEMLWILRKRVDQIWDLRKFTTLKVFGMGNTWGKRRTRDGDQLEAVVQERAIVAWPRVLAVGMERGGLAKGHGAG